MSAGKRPALNTNLNTKVQNQRLTQLDSLMGKLMAAGNAETESKKLDRSQYGKSKRLAKKIGATIEIERYGTETHYWVYGPDKVEEHPEWSDDEHFQTDWGGVYYFLIKVVDFIKEKNL